MGKTLNRLAKADVNPEAVFNRRFVVEVCEKIHVHYRNLRIQLNLADFLEVCQGTIKAYERWLKMGSPEPKAGVHIELCRRVVAQDPINDQIQINLNENLYLKNEGRIFAEGAELQDPVYVHLKLRDLRLELTIDEFKQLASAVKQAEVSLADSSLSPLFSQI